jgi:hypothetical protein
MNKVLCAFSLSYLTVFQKNLSRDTKHKCTAKAVFVKAMNRYGELEVQLHLFLNLALY